MPKNTRWCEERKEMEKHMKCLKRQVDDALAKQHEAMTRAVKLAQRNQELMKELKAVDRLALCVEEECNSTLKDSADKISKAQAELDDNICKLQKMDAKVNTLIKENQMLKRKNCELVQKRKEAKEAFLEALQQKDRMLVELRNNEEELCQKMEKMSQTLENQKRRIMCLEAELEECQGHQKKVKPQTKGTKICKGKSQQKSPKCRGRHNRTNCHKDANNSECTCCSFDDNNSKDHGSSRGSHSRIIKIHSESPLSHLTLQLVGRNAEDKCEDSKSSSEEELMDDVSDDCSQISEEEIDANMKENKCQGDYAHSRSPPPYCLASPEVVMARLKRERDIAQCDVERLQAEILSLRKRLETATDVQMQEKCQYEKSLAKEEEKIKKLQLECDNLYKYQSSLCSKVQGQEESISKLMECLEAVKEELGKEQCLNKYLKKKVDEKTEDLNNLGLECRRKKNEVDQLQKCNSQQREKNIALESQVIAMRKGCGRIEHEMEKLEKENVRLWTEIMAQENDYDQMKRELYDKVAMIDKLMKRFSALQEELSSSKNENKKLLANVMDMCSQKNISDSEIRRLENELKNTKSVVEEYEKQICCLNQKIDELGRCKDLEQKKRVEFEAQLTSARDMCAKLQMEKTTQNKCTHQKSPRHGTNMECEVRHLQKEVNMLKCSNLNLLEVLESIDQVLSCKGNRPLPHESKKQELQSELLRLCKSVQEVKKQLYPNSCSSSRSKRILPIEEEGDICGKVEGSAENGPSLQREGRNVGMMERKAHKCKTPPELSKRSENCLQQMNHESRQHTHTTIKASSAPPRMRCKNDCVHSVRKLIVHSTDKRTSGESGKHPERSKCSPKESEVGAREKGSPSRKSTSPGPKIHVHANIASGGFVNVELQDDDESGGEYCSHRSTRV
ncbi:myosin-13-like isoform X2 [Ischnura elegans]|uniref:myosin-13-like isoform X2 n=1 Tax=Ischnura elegans TaxID=197161 RepID=UPI001ED8B2CC|nr:myosin-13-like isoform X2 [Ischnura elegans]